MDSDLSRIAVGAWWNNGGPDRWVNGWAAETWVTLSGDVGNGLMTLETYFWDVGVLVESWVAGCASSCTVDGYSGFMGAQAGSVSTVRSSLGRRWVSAGAVLWEKYWIVFATSIEAFALA
jgi:hypothetical protein